ncbi:MAG TPA: ATP-binding protein, partial [Bacteroidales bacterium]|nr:ATP-binding protein [Bacteroidales bacterium]
EDQNMYQYILEGFDNEWSNWTLAGFKEYSNLPDGNYTFRVKARNIYGIESDEAQYRFAILPPWYRTIWAYIGYIVALIILVYGVIMINLRRLRKANYLLEKAVKERTEEIMRQKEEISEINENLLLQQEELKTTVETLYDMQEHLIKSEKMANLGQLIAGIAHEINSPLGAIKASVNDINNNSREILLQLPELIKKLNEKEFRLFLELVSRSSQVSLPSNSKEERFFKRALQKKLEEINLPDAAYKADTLVDMGIHDDIDYFIDILGNGKINSLQVAYNLSQLIKNGRTIETAIERASKMVQALKGYSHNASREEKAEANITEGIITVLTLFQNQLKYRIQLDTEFEPVPKIYCYPDELNQVWTNLITNAIDAMDGKGRLSISVANQGEWIIVKVGDTGKGIPAEVQTRIFDAFFSTKPAGEGSGLGLFITKEIIDKHGGKIVFETKAGIGTTFIISLPVLTRIHKN